MDIYPVSWIKITSYKLKAERLSEGIRGEDQDTMIEIVLTGLIGALCQALILCHIIRFLTVSLPGYHQISFINTFVICGYKLDIKKDKKAQKNVV